jgi:phage gp36-like protein
MAYASSADFILAFGTAEYMQLTDRDVNAASDPGVCDAALAAGSSVIDGYAKAGGYAVPLSPVDPVVKQINLDLARFELSGNQASERVILGYQDANKRLADIAARRLLLIAGTPVTDPTVSGVGVGIAYTTPELGFTPMPEWGFPIPGVWS